MQEKYFNLMPNVFKKRAILKQLANAPMSVSNIEKARKFQKTQTQKRRKVRFSGSIHDTVARNKMRETPVRIYTPEGKGPFPALMLMHGGGFCLGSVDSTDNFCRRISELSACVVVSVDYALAPENKYPFALNECYQVALWIKENASSLNVNPEKLTVGGNSAGANLAASICLMAREYGDFSPVMQILVCPVLDLYTDLTEKSKDAPEIMFNSKVLRQFMEYYFNNHEEESREVWASPLFAQDHSALPPAVIITAGVDPLKEEGERYANKLQSAGVRVEHRHYKGLMHDFPIFTGILKEGENAAKFVARQLETVF